MIDFTSSLYLGMKHSSTKIEGWSQLTTGAPAALSEFALSKQIGNEIARMQELETGVAAPSTLHLYWDLYGFLSTKPIIVFIDEKIYPVSKYGIERLMVKKIPIYPFKHFDANDLAKLVESKFQKSKQPVVFTDGWCAQCGTPAPIKDFFEILKPVNGILIVDDTQAFGILGERKNNTIYSSDGGGLLKWLGVNNRNIITVTSLVKAFGVPMAVISGNPKFISGFKNASETRVNSSPVSIAHLNVAIHALIINHNSGDERRKKLWNNLSFIRNELKQSEINLSGGIFPVQSITCLSLEEATEFHNRLIKLGIKTVLTETHNHLPAVTFIIRSDHTFKEIKTLSQAIQKAYFSLPHIFQTHGLLHTG